MNSSRFLIFLLYPQKRYIYYYRRCHNAKNRISYLFWKYRMLRLGREYGLEIGDTAIIGEDLQINHPFGITISGYAKIGKHCRIHKGATIGVKNGPKDVWGAPTLGDYVYVGINSAIIGKITIGDDVLIAANTLVTKDVPSHSLVFGNPMQIQHRDHATKYYIAVSD